MTDAYANVLRHPRSIKARQRLLEEWTGDADPRKELLRLQLDDHLNLNLRSGSKATRMIESNGPQLAGSIGGRVKTYSFELGLVTGVGISAEHFVRDGAELFMVTPLITLGLDDPGIAPAFLDMKELSQLVRIGLGGVGLDDELAIAIAQSPNLREMRVMWLDGGSITSRGLRALASSKMLPNLITIELTGNPCASEVTQVENRGAFLIGNAGEDYWAKARDSQFFSSDSFNPANFFWPPVFDDYAWTE